MSETNANRPSSWIESGMGEVYRAWASAAEQCLRQCYGSDPTNMFRSPLMPQDWWRMWEGFMPSGPAGTSSRASSEPFAPANMMPMLAQAYAMAWIEGLRLWSRAAQSWSELYVTQLGARAQEQRGASSKTTRDAGGREA
jgi:hypothetical protein